MCEPILRPHPPLGQTHIMSFSSTDKGARVCLAAHKAARKAEQRSAAMRALFTPEKFAEAPRTPPAPLPVLAPSREERIAAARSGRQLGKGGDKAQWDRVAGLLDF